LADTLASSSPRLTPRALAYLPGATHTPRKCVHAAGLDLDLRKAPATKGVLSKLAGPRRREQHEGAEKGSSLCWQLGEGDVLASLRMCMCPQRVMCDVCVCVCVCVCVRVCARVRARAYVSDACAGIWAGARHIHTGSPPSGVTVTRPATT